MTPSPLEKSAAYLALCDQIGEHGPCRFDDFMTFALYHPRYGYYSRAVQIFGQEGDFITAPELTPLFGQTIGQALVPLIKQTGGVVYEFGAGTGKLARDILSVAHGHIDRYVIIDVSGGLKEKQMATLSARFDRDVLQKVEWSTHLPEKLKGVVLGNELLDSIPVRRFCLSNDGLKEAFVSLEGDRLELLWSQADTSQTRKVEDLHEQYGPWPYPYYLEMSEQVEAWVTSITRRLDGVALMIDYGKSGAEYYAPTHTQGHLRAHARHIAHDGFLEKLGEQDLTCHVDFSLIYRAIADNGGQLEGYCTQGKWLLELGILDLANSLIAKTSDRPTIELNQALNMLVNQSDMGESFKVICWSAGMEPDDCGLIQAFLSADDSHRL